MGTNSITSNQTASAYEHPLATEETTESTAQSTDQAPSLTDRTEQRVVLGANIKWQGVYPLVGGGNYPNLAIGGGVKAGYRLAPNSLWHFGAAIDVQALQSPVVPRSVDKEEHKEGIRTKEGVYVSAKPMFGVSSDYQDVYVKAGPSMLYDSTTDKAHLGLGGDLVIGSGLYLSAGGDYFVDNKQSVGRFAIGMGW